MHLQPWSEWVWAPPPLRPLSFSTNSLYTLDKSKIPFQSMQGRAQIILGPYSLGLALGTSAGGLLWGHFLWGGLTLGDLYWASFGTVIINNKNNKTQTQGVVGSCFYVKHLDRLGLVMDKCIAQMFALLSITKGIEISLDHQEPNSPTVGL